MKKNIYRIISLIAVCACFLFSTHIGAMSENENIVENELEIKLKQLEEKYDVTIKPAAKTRVTMTESEIKAMLKDMESKLAAGQKALKENNDAYEHHINELKASGRLEESNIRTESNSTASNIEARAGLYGHITRK